MANNNVFSPVVNSPGTTPGTAPATVAAPQWGVIHPTRKWAAAQNPQPAGGFLGLYDTVTGLFVVDPTENT
jgi:hypothetical protein